MREPKAFVGIGLSSRCSAEELATLVAAALTEAGPLAVAGLATLDRRTGHPALQALAAARGWAVTGLSPDDLQAQADRIRSGSDRVRALTGSGSVCEAAALAAAGPGSLLRLSRRQSAQATVAVAVCGGNERR
ncbi:cobalamin biosynthesis protein [Pannonibacter tanglangensis]|uniref:CobE/GbiG C-terminal domain-containing protein n=1 Tax=Pannonibacter tanglangensis TaxID=2750084 RepID=A0ABW9ZQ94_9HYPH|nr:hypothetical protein [Pannonibacter sp. XCT-34]